MRGTAQPSTSRTVPVTEELNAHGLLALPWATALYLEPAWQEGGELAMPNVWCEHPSGGTAKALGPTSPSPFPP